MVKLLIDGIEVSAKENMTILEAAKNAGIDIPQLCHHPALKPIGSCRLCLVEVKGYHRPVAACQLPVEDGMEVITKGLLLDHLRKDMIRLILLHHPLDCPICDKSGECALQDITTKLGITDQVFLAQPVRKLPKFISALIKLYSARCILCGRCVSVCSEVQGANVLTYTTKAGYATEIVLSPDGYPCESCGQCIAVCPVGAMIDFGFTHKARAWNLKCEFTICTHCGIGCPLTLNLLKNEVVRITTVPANPVSNGTLCNRGRFGFDFIYSPSRLLSPLVRTERGYEVITWDTAIEEIADKLKAIIRRYSPDSIAILGSPRLTNEEAYLLSRFARTAIGTNNLDLTASYKNKGFFDGLMAAFGSFQSTAKFSDLFEADLIVTLGTNFVHSHPILALNIIKAVTKFQSELIQIGRTGNKLEPYTSLWLKGKIGGEAYIFEGICKILLENKETLKEFAEHISGYNDFQKDLQKKSLERIAQLAGVGISDLNSAAELIKNSKKIVFIIAPENIEQKVKPAWSQSACNLVIASGKLFNGTGKYILLWDKGNLQGAIDMGLSPNMLPGQVPIQSSETRNLLASLWGIAPPMQIGKNAAEILKGIADGSIKALFLIGEEISKDLISPASVEALLKSLELLVVIDPLKNPISSSSANYLLPCATFAEKEGTYTNIEGRLQKLRKLVAAPPGAKTDMDIISLLSAALGFELKFSSSNQVFEEIKKVVPYYGEIRLEDLDYFQEKPSLFKRNFPLKYTLQIPLHEYERPPLKEDELYLVWGKTLYYHSILSLNSQNISRLLTRGSAFINPYDGIRLGFKEGEKVILSTDKGTVDVNIIFDRNVPLNIILIPDFETEIFLNLIDPIKPEDLIDGKGQELLLVKVKKVGN